MISDERLLDFCRALVSTVRSGLTLSDAFETLARSRRHGRVIARAAELAGGGMSLHEAFSAQKVFPPVFIALLRAGEEGGKTDDFLELYADCIEVRVKFRRQIERLLVYPVFVAVLALALFFLVSFKVVPMVMEPLLKSGIKLPPQAFWFRNLAEYLYARWPQLLVIGSVSALVIRMFLLSGPGRKARGLAGHLLPLFRFATAEARLYYIYTTMGLLMQAGLPLSAMMDVLLQFSQDDIITRYRFRRAVERLAVGESFSGSVASLMPDDDRHAMEIAEKAGRLEDTLLSRAKLHYDRHLHRLKLLVTGFTISTMIGVALVAFALILTLVWPAVSVLSGIKADSSGSTSQSLPTDGAAHGKTAVSRQDARTGTFNANNGGQVADFMQNYGVRSGGPAGSGAQAGSSGHKKMLAPVSPIGRIQFQQAQPTSIQPSDIKSH